MYLQGEFPPCVKAFVLPITPNANYETIWRRVGPIPTPDQNG